MDVPTDPNLCNVAQFLPMTHAMSCVAFMKDNRKREIDAEREREMQRECH
jgi:hypothetical protein